MPRAAVRGRGVRRCRDGARDLLRSRSGRGRRRDGACRAAGRQRLCLCLGHARRRIPVRGDDAGDRRARLSDLRPPSVEASRIDALRTLWQGAGLVEVATCTISIERTFDDFDGSGASRAPARASHRCWRRWVRRTCCACRSACARVCRPRTTGASLMERAPTRYADASRAEARIAAAARRGVGSARHRDRVVARVAVDELARAGRCRPWRAARHSTA